MAELASIQEFFAGAVQGSSSVLESVDPAMTTAHVAGNSRLSPAEQLEIYREQFWIRHISVLVEDFATVHHLLGHEAFSLLCEKYLAAFPPTDFSLRDLGLKLPAFVSQQSPYMDDALLVDCARVEWAFVDAFDAAEAPPLDVAALTTIPEDAWSGMRLSLHPSVQRLSLRYPAHEYRASVKEGAEPSRPEPQESFLVVYRGPEALQYITIEPLAFALLDRIAAGMPLGDACDEIAVSEAITQELEAKVGAYFQSWAALGWISSIAV